MIRLYLTAIRGILTAVCVELWPFIVAAVVVLCLLSGCTLTPAAQKALAERRVNLTTWGVYCIEITLCGVGYLQYQRNPVENLEPAKPEVP